MHRDKISNSQLGSFISTISRFFVKQPGEEDGNDQQDEYHYRDEHDDLLEKYFKCSDLIHQIVTEEGLMEMLQKKNQKDGGGSGVDEAKHVHLTIMRLLKNHQN